MALLESGGVEMMGVMAGLRCSIIFIICFFFV